MPKIVPLEVQERILEDLRTGYSNKEIAERSGTSEGYVSRLKHKKLAEKAESPEDKVEPTADHFKFYKRGGDRERAVIKSKEPYEEADRYWQQWCAANEDEFRRQLEERDRQIQKLREDNYLLRNANTRLRRTLAEYEKRSSFSGMFKELMLVQALRDMRG